MRNFRVHVLVLRAFVGPRPTGLVCRHLNGQSTDNRLANLEYSTQSDNLRDMRIHGTNHNFNKTHCAHGHPYAGDNVMVNVKGGRECRACVRDRSRRCRQRKKLLGTTP